MLKQSTDCVTPQRDNISHPIMDIIQKCEKKEKIVCQHKPSSLYGKSNAIRADTVLSATQLCYIQKTTTLRD